VCATQGSSDVMARQPVGNRSFLFDSQRELSCNINVLTIDHYGSEVLRGSSPCLQSVLALLISHLACEAPRKVCLARVMLKGLRRLADGSIQSSKNPCPVGHLGALDSAPSVDTCAELERSSSHFDPFWGPDSHRRFGSTRASHAERDLSQAIETLEHVAARAEREAEVLARDHAVAFDLARAHLHRRSGEDRLTI
jgi:hypothetical protein